MYNQTYNGFRPNVNVTIEPAEDVSIQPWMEQSNATLTLYGFKLIKSDIDDKSESGVRVMSGEAFGLKGNLIQRIILANGRAYIITAFRPQALNTDPKVWLELNEILNSFRINN